MTGTLSFLEVQPWSGPWDLCFPTVWKRTVRCHVEIKVKNWETLDYGQIPWTDTIAITRHMQVWKLSTGFHAWVLLVMVHHKGLGTKLSEHLSSHPNVGSHIVRLIWLLMGERSSFLAPFLCAWLISLAWSLVCSSVVQLLPRMWEAFWKQNETKPKRNMAWP